MILKSLILKKAMDAAVDSAKKAAIAAAKKGLKQSAKVRITAEDVEESLQHHMKFVVNWAGEVSFNDLQKPRLTRDIFVHLDIAVYPKRLRVQTAEVIKNIPLKKIFKDPHHIILLGQPGAGKTTSTKFICEELLRSEKSFQGLFSFPLVIRLRDLNGNKASPDSSPLLDRIFSTLGLRIEFPLSLTGDKSSVLAERKAVRERLLAAALDELDLLLILDGFDELQEQKDRQQALQDISMLALDLNRSRLLVTSRTGDFAYNVKNTVQYEISPLTVSQIETFARKWLKDRTKAKQFIASINASPFNDTAIRPLTLAHLCAIYQRVGAIPEKPKSVYQKIIYLFLEEWDQQRAIVRKSKYGEFDVFRKYEFLSALAYELTVSLHKSVFTSSDLRVVYEAIHKDFGLPSNQENQVVSEIETHTGIFLQSAFETFEFAHKSLQEYLAAQYLLKLPTLPPMKTLHTIPSELAIAVASSSKPSAYLSELVFQRMVGKGLPPNFIHSFVDRLALEKPDFDSDINLGLAIVVLASLGGARNSRLRTLIKSTVNKTSLSIVRTHYQKISSTDYDHTLKKRIVKSSDAVPNLPEFLNVDNELYSLIQSER